CLVPKTAKEAAKQLRKLGSPVEDEKIASYVPKAVGADATAVAATMREGLGAEWAGRYPDAESLYRRAHRLDPDDPVPTRYLAELYRHHTGEWAKSRRLFEAMLARPIDPV